MFLQTFLITHICLHTNRMPFFKTDFLSKIFSYIFYRIINQVITPYCAFINHWHFCENMGKNHLYISLYQHGIPLCYSCQIFYGIYYIRMHLLFFYNRVLRAVYLQLFIIGRKQCRIKIQVYYLVFFFPNT